MLTAALAQMMPQYEVQKQEIAKAYAESGRKLDISQEQRGVFNAGFSQTQEANLEQAKVAEQAKQLA